MTLDNQEGAKPCPVCGGAALYSRHMGSYGYTSDTAGIVCRNSLQPYDVPNNAAGRKMLGDGKCWVKMPNRSLEAFEPGRGMYSIETEVRAALLEDWNRRDTSQAEQFARALENEDFANVADALGARMCCGGQMCGCRGSSVGDYLAHELREAFK